MNENLDVLWSKLVDHLFKFSNGIDYNQIQTRI